MATRTYIQDSVPSYEDERASVVATGKYVFYRNPWYFIKEYVISIFPILSWIHRYNFTWLYGDLVAGISVGLVLVPQSMSYAQIATLPPQYGLYSSFVGVMIYCFFATSKDVSIGPVAVMSLQVSKVIAHVVHAHPEFKGQEPLIATTLALLTGAIAMGLGVLRLGFILEFISVPAVMGFMTGSALNIAVGQVPGLFGTNKLFNTRAATYEVIINSFKYLGHSTADAAFGLISLFVLYFSKWFFTWASKRYPRYARTFFFGSVLRNGVTVIVATAISYGICHSHKKSGKFPISILKTVPRGLQHTGAQHWNKSLMGDLASELPISTVILLLEHIAISKSFGRVNDYKINPNQELIAIGTTNLIGTLFSAYPSTGSFSRSALKAKCGVRTPLAGIFTGIVVLIAIYALTGAFFWIPNATLSAVIIHAVGDLIAHPKTTFRFYKCSPVEALIFFVAVLLTVFVTIESGIYFAIAASLVLLLLKLAFPTGQFLGRVEYCQVNSPQIVQQDAQPAAINDADDDSVNKQKAKVSPEPSAEAPRIALENKQRRYKWVPLNHKGINPDVQVRPPPPGVFVFRPSESWTYPNCSRQSDILIDEIKKQTKKGLAPDQEPKLGDRPWNDPGPRKKVYDPNFVDNRPILRAVVFDLSATPHVDLTGVQALVDIRSVLDKYANRKVEYHFVGILSKWTRRALLSEGFGGDTANPPEQHYVFAAPAIDPRFRGLDEFGASGSGSEDNIEEQKNVQYKDVEERDTNSAFNQETGEFVPLVGTDTPFFHFDVPELDELYA